MSYDLAHLPDCRHCASVPPLQRLIWEEKFVKIVAESVTMSNDANCHGGQFARFVLTDILYFVLPVILASGTHHLTAGGEVAVEDFGEGQCKIYSLLVVWRKNISQFILRNFFKSNL